MHRKQRQTQIAGTNPRRRGDSPVTRPQSGPTRRARESGGGMREGDQLVRLPRSPRSSLYVTVDRLPLPEAVSDIGAGGDDQREDRVLRLPRD
ncbi:hypothetical protein ACFX2A_015100 [Malus domestica]